MKDKCFNKGLKENKKWLSESTLEGESSKKVGDASRPKYWRIKNSPKSAQQEMVGFVLIVVLVVIGLMVFLVVSINSNP
ncbi:MAG: hypothetical protein NUV97_00505, partial [archaeon]|nr:hypothetical protein [archaeon]